MCNILIYIYALHARIRALYIIFYYFMCDMVAYEMKQQHRAHSSRRPRIWILRNPSYPRRANWMMMMMVVWCRFCAKMSLTTCAYVRACGRQWFSTRRLTFVRFMYVRVCVFAGNTTIPQIHTHTHTTSTSCICVEEKWTATQRRAHTSMTNESVGVPYAEILQFFSLHVTLSRSLYKWTQSNGVAH